MTVSIRTAMNVCSSFSPSATFSIKLGLETSSRWRVDHNINKRNLLSHINSTASFMWDTRQYIVVTTAPKSTREHFYTECFYSLSVMKHCINGKDAHCARMMAVISLCSSVCSVPPVILLNPWHQELLLLIVMFCFSHINLF